VTDREPYHDVRLGLTALQAEYMRAVLSHEADSVAEEIGAKPDEDAELEETAEMLELLIGKLDRAIEEGRSNRD
jgi:hypothetical protein